MKYVIFKGDKFVLIPKAMEHSEVKHIGEPISAGFCQITQTQNEFGDIRYEVSCWGESVSLNLKSSPKKDAATITIGLNV